MNIDEITRIAELMTAHDLTEFLVEGQDLKLSLRRNRKGPEPVAVPAVAAAPAVSVLPAAAPATPAAPAASAAPAAMGATIDSPIVGTFYTASSPEAKPFVKAGDTVTEETVVCIVEAMKVMNEIKAEKRGVIRKILVDNGKPVEFGQPLFELEETA